ncbi:MAG: CrcB protein [Burkholderiaceae bacterium]|jgi:CrcB protein
MYPVLAMCVGASLGAISRWQLSLWFNHSGHANIAIGTLSANWIGAYLVGMGFVFLQTHTALDPMWRLLLMTGFLGALTTFSTFSIETVNLLQTGQFLDALINSALHLVGSLVLTYAGIHTAQWLWANSPS